WNAEGRHQGQGFDIPLSEVGLDQAQALAQRLKNQSFQRAVASPLLRVKQTAERELEGHDLPLILDPDLMEIAHGAWEGRLASDIQHSEPELRRAWREAPHTVRLPGGETLQEVQARMGKALHRACEGLGETDTLLMVSHDGANRTLLCRILGLPLARLWAFHQAPTTLNLLEGPDPERLSLVRLNDATHLVPLFGEAVHRKL
ncbi:MAG: histidine phosphatase family protein, partial [Firmicutes bacterium]|nr:histidine phosphatase family protein [Bacillota bacterium]